MSDGNDFWCGVCGGENPTCPNCHSDVPTDGYIPFARTAHSTSALDLIDAVKIAAHDALSSDYQMLESQAVDVSLAAITAVRDYDAAHSTLAPDVSDEALFTMVRQAYKDMAIDPAMDPIFNDDYDWAVALCDRAGVVAVRQAIANSNAAVDVPDGFQHGRFTLLDGGSVVVDLFRDHSTILNARNHRRGTGPTIAAAIVNAANGEDRADAG